MEPSKWEFPQIPTLSHLDRHCNSTTYQNSGGNSHLKSRGGRGEVPPKVRTQDNSVYSMLMSQKRRRHTPEFRRRAVELLISGRSLHELARELDVGATTLWRWKEMFLHEAAAG